jgi:hypothetical protein
MTSKPALAFFVLWFLLYCSDAYGARCPYPEKFYRPSTGECENKAGNPYYRGAIRPRPRVLKQKKRHRPIEVREVAPVKDIIAPEIPLPPPNPLRQPEPIRPIPSIIDKRWPT